MSQAMTELKAAVEHGTRMYAAFKNAEDLVNALASADNYQAEVQARIDALKIEEAALAAANEKATIAAQNAIIDAQTTCKAADAYAAETRKHADDDAAETRSNAKADTEQRELQADGYVDSAKQALAELNVDIMAKQAVLDDLTVRTTEAHAKIKQLLGS